MVASVQQHNNDLEPSSPADLLLTFLFQP